MQTRIAAVHRNTWTKDGQESPPWQHHHTTMVPAWCHRGGSAMENLRQPGPQRKKHTSGMNARAHTKAGKGSIHRKDGTPSLASHWWHLHLDGCVGEGQPHNTIVWGFLPHELALMGQPNVFTTMCCVIKITSFRGSKIMHRKTMPSLCGVHMAWFQLSVNNH